MKKTFLILFILLFVVSAYSCAKRNEQTATKMKSTDPINIYDIKVKTIDGKEVNLSDYKGKVLMIVNTASKCGYTPQYQQLEAIYEKYKAQGFEVLAFPSNDFGGQEPGTNEEIKTFCTSNYNVTFPLFDKVKVLGYEKNPLYTKLINYEPAGDIGWNFEKFIIDKNGNVVGRFKSKIKPDADEITNLIESELKK